MARRTTTEIYEKVELVATEISVINERLKHAKEMDTIKFQHIEERIGRQDNEICGIKERISRVEKSIDAKLEAIIARLDADKNKAQEKEKDLKVELTKLTLKIGAILSVIMIIVGAVIQALIRKLLP